MLIQRITAFFISLITIIASFLGFGTGLVKPQENFHVTSYVVGDRILDKSSLCSEDFDIITDAILFGCANFDNQGNVILKTEILEKSLKNLREVIGERNVTITLNILGPSYTSQGKGWDHDMELQAIEHDKAFKSGVLEENIAKVIYDYGFDGVHFDYEFPISPSAWNTFSKFLVKLDDVMSDKIIGIAAAEWDLDISTKALACVDYLQLMMYDIYDEEGRHSTYETATELINKALLMGIPRERIHFGLPFYARPTDRDTYWYDYKLYYDKLDENNFYYDESIDKSFWFNTPDVIAEKTEFALNNGFGGVMIWHYSCDLPSTNPNSLLRAIGNVTNK